ncbi:MAG TPA: alanine racemase [Bellilinea sp.]|nr:alanine racemase [Bellilinea sp.]
MAEMDGVVTWAEIDLAAIRKNIRSFKRHVGDAVEIFAVVKANAYGHGAVPVAKAALDAGARRLAVHRLTEGIELRQAGLTAPILVMGYTPPAGAQAMVEWDLTPSCITTEFAQAFSAQAAANGKIMPLHVKVDTGMSRYGLFPAEVIPFLTAVSELPGIKIEGLFTHFATADSSDLTWVLQQIATFDQLISTTRSTGMDIPIIHAANSATTMKLSQAHYNAVRPGISMYGMNPSSDWEPVFELNPALTLKSTVSRVRELPAGAGVSYGRTFVTSRPTMAALVPVGYGDGYHRILTNKGVVLIRGQRAPIMGRVCMDQFVVDVTGIPGVQQDDEVVLVGRQGQERISAEEVGRLAGSINYEVTTGLLPRVVRKYIE